MNYKHLKTLQFLMDYATTTENKGLEYNLKILASEIQEDILTAQIEAITEINQLN